MHIIQLSLYVTFGFLIWISSTRTKSNTDRNTQLLMYKDGVVAREKFVYFSVEEEGDLVLSLHSFDGDADIYIAEHPKVPTYEPDTYDLHAATCGEDVIEIPKSFKRPIIIGIYGNSIYETTNFKLRVERIDNDKFEKTSSSDFVHPRSTQDEPQKNKPDGSTANKPKIKVNNKVDLKSLFFSILEVLASAL
ncbi:UPF0669 protein C6orf120 homolog isoform X1 [Harmonia axyridis]|uniref:UPF0669 protein C6orf120 homolog isoform X1 n=1 Tax=Harmonia axyridis TaxID=115357 RepID=UPI001E277F36|nr:UPF0669 protein C6orf120 homolog isoform X1 [Harmonia axyridis]